MGRWIKPLPVGYYTVNQLAAKFCVSRVTIYRLIDDLALSPVKIDDRTLFSSAEVRRFVKEQKAREKSGAGRVYDKTGAARDLGAKS